MLSHMSMMWKSAILSMRRPKSELGGVVRCVYQYCLSHSAGKVLRGSAAHVDL